MRDFSASGSWEKTLNGRSLADIGGLTQDKQELSELLEIFQRTTKRELHALHQALENDDLDAARRVAHTLKGMAALLGAGKMNVLCGSMEQAARDGDRPKVERYVDLLVAVSERTRRAMDAKLKEAA